MIPNARRIHVAAAAVAALAGTAAGQSTLHVPSEFPTIQSAINASVNGDTVLVADGVYAGPGNRALDFGGRTITVKSQGGPAACTIDCQGVNRAITFENNETRQSVLEGFTIINGSSIPIGGAGGGIRIFQASPTIRNCVVRGCIAFSYGGGIAAEFGPGSGPLLESCTIEQCGVGTVGGLVMSGGGGGVYCNGGSLVMTSCIVRNNVTHDGQSSIFAETFDGGRGAGIIALSSQLSLTACSVYGNLTGDGGGGDPDPCAFGSSGGRGTSGGAGGGLYVAGGATLALSCRFVGNVTGNGAPGYSCPNGGGRGGSGGDGAGVYHAGGDLQLVNCIVAGNHTGISGSGGISTGSTGGDGGRGARGGGIYSLNPVAASIINCTITGNTVPPGGAAGAGGAGNGLNGQPGQGGGLWHDGGSLAIANTILWGNLDAAGGGQTAQLAAPESSISVRYSCIQSLATIPGPGNTSINPLLSDQLGRLSATSGCIDAGDGDAIPAWAATDADQFPRRRDNTGMPNTGVGSGPMVDIGAFEVQNNTCYANCDESTVAPALNVADFVCFQSRFSAGDNYANCDGSSASPRFNVNDFICFMGRYSTGCP